jgi:hypothetical protein
MKNIIGTLGIFSFTLVMIFSTTTCDLTTSPVTGGNTPPINGPSDIPISRSVNRFQAESYSRNDKIKYSFSYKGYDFYYIYLGELTNIPLYYDDAYYHSGMVDHKYTFTETRTETTTITRTITRSSQEAVSITDEHTESTTNGAKLSSEIKATFPIIDADLKVGAENSWSQVVSGKTGHTITKTTSLTDTITNATTQTYTTMTAREYHFTRDVQQGYYKWTYFANSDVYLYVIRDSKTNEISYEFREHVIPDTFYWALDYSDTISFNKTDTTGFKLDPAILEDLPKPVISITDDDIPGFTVTFNANGATGGTPPASQKVYSGDSITAPNQGTLSYNERAFDGWNTRVNGSGDNYAPGTKISITGNITLYANWVIISKEYTIKNTFSSGLLGTSFTGFNTVDDISSFYRADFDIAKLKSLGYTQVTFTYTYSMYIWGTIEYRLRLHNVTTNTQYMVTDLHTPDNGKSFNNRAVTFTANLSGFENNHKVEIQADYRKTQALWGGDFEIKPDRKLKVTFS